MPVCTKCLEQKPATEFYESNPSQCKACRGERHKAYIAKHCDGQARYQRRVKLKRLYGITEDDYERLFAAQGGVCAICKRRADELGNKTGRGAQITRLAIDHSHTSGRVRGLLCQHCNLAIGLLSDNPEALATAAAYLAKAAKGGL